ncbi:hypothetical protein [Pseudanabaena sp. 'Roaring Creek']|uniref:hypothetical protein n=1 Tax=Pseudanabaena sp. 'Roaring Creek' TaxID=1681830 RepID=UPI000ADBC320|nr:hypothetical protein [Pseudanabaena sp. 'Roaring Creek']
MKRRKIKFALVLLGLSSFAIALSGCISASHSQLTDSIKTSNIRTTNVPNQQIVATPSAAISPSAQTDAVEKCSEAKAVSPSQKLKLRRCTDSRDRENEILILEENSKEIGRWNSGICNRAYCRGDFFDAFEIDLDGDGKQELIIARLLGSNTLGVAYWNIYIFQDPSIAPFQLLMHFVTNDYNRLGTFVPDGDRFEVWTTQWAWTGETTGIIGQQWRYRNGELIPTDHPVLRRWLSFNFAAERSQTHHDPRIPYLWLANPKAQAYEENPLLQPYEITSIEDGTIQDVRNVSDINNSCTEKSILDCMIVVDFKPDFGDPQSYIYARKSTSNLLGFYYFGDWSSRRIYPVSYLPSDPQKWLKDKRGKIIIDNSNKNYSFDFAQLAYTEG